MNKTQNKQKKENEYACRTEEPLFFSNRTEDEIGILLGDKLQLRLRSIKETFASQTTRSNGNLTLMNVIPRTTEVVIKAQQDIDTHALMRFEHIVEHIIGRIEESYRPYCKGQNKEIIRQTHA